MSCLSALRRGDDGAVAERWTRADTADGGDTGGTTAKIRRMNSFAEVMNASSACWSAGPGAGGGASSEAGGGGGGGDFGGEWLNGLRSMMLESESDDESVEKVGDGKGMMGVLALVGGGCPLMDASTTRLGRGAKGQTGGRMTNVSMADSLQDSNTRGRASPTDR